MSDSHDPKEPVEPTSPPIVEPEPEPLVFEPEWIDRGHQGHPDREER